ncbi:unnamed protein product [Effrenium voratum]|uniref:Uncharacterized protein n=1 Tax=Effrenium voratum TaxID=2562239 RepID=A0AA36IWX6_9DINO|nr:unnamed protein product [Effrenium voratum]
MAQKGPCCGVTNENADLQLRATFSTIVEDTGASQAGQVHNHTDLHDLKSCDFLSYVKRMENVEANKHVEMAGMKVGLLYFFDKVEASAARGRLCEARRSMQRSDLPMSARLDLPMHEMGVLVGKRLFVAYSYAPGRTDNRTNKSCRGMFCQHGFLEFRMRHVPACREPQILSRTAQGSS